MQLLDSVLDWAVGSVCIPAAVYILKRVYVWYHVTRQSVPKYERLVKPERPAPPPRQITFSPEKDSPEKRAAWLDDTKNYDALDDLVYLQPGDRIGELLLRERIGGGRTTVVWRAWSDDAGREVAVKFLRYRSLGEASLVEQFQKSADLLSGFRNEAVVGVLRCPKPWPCGSPTLTWHMPVTLCSGTPLPILTKRPELRTDLVRALGRLACDLQEAHDNDLVFRDLAPEDLLVDQDALADVSRKAIRVIDFDGISATGAPRARLPAGPPGFAALEAVAEMSDVDGRADVFSMGRIAAYVYNGGEAINLYAFSTAEAVGLLNCPPRVKDVLVRATAPRREDRIKSLCIFGKELQAALDGTRRRDVRDTLRQERRKINLIVAQACLGTYLMMMIARPSLALWPGVHLSDRSWVAAFHGLFGSIAWGTCITTAFLLYLIRIRTRRGPSKLWAILYCGVGGLLAGLLCDLPSLLVTNEHTLQCLGWIPSSVVHGGEATSGARLASAFLGTRMAWAYPLTGFLTGCGLALCLDRGITIAHSASVSGSGVLPVPTKDDVIPAGAMSQSMRKVLKSWTALLYLAIPLLFAWLVALVLNPAAPGEALQCNHVLPHPWARSFGEGAVHFLGAVGLTAGFFYRIALVEPSWR